MIKITIATGLHVNNNHGEVFYIIFKIRKEKYNRCD